jgi:hypothetical protein
MKMHQPGLRASSSLRWLFFAGAGVLVGALAFLTLGSVQVAMTPLFLGAGLVAAAVEVVRARRNSNGVAVSNRQLGGRALIAFVLVAGCGFATFALLFAALVAP